MRKTLSRWFQDAWYGEMYLSTWIMPLSMIYLDVIRLRRFLYRKGFFKSTRLPVPVIIVGNITVGGTGKTPLVIWLADYLQKAGFKPGIISRGYRGQSDKKPLLVHPETDPALAGDEPVVIARHTTAPVMVGEQRVEVALNLLKQNHCDVIISDDGLQHYALQRDIEIAVIDGLRRFGNGYCLPAGPLREPVERLNEVDLVIVNGEAREKNEFSMSFDADVAINLKSGQKRALKEFCGKPCHALAGIGNPDRFYRMLAGKGIEFQRHSFPDHYKFTPESIHFNDTGTVLMTEKDAVKCTSFAKDNFWYVPIRARPQTHFIQQLHKLLTDKTHG